MSRKGWVDLDNQQRSDMIAHLDETARDALSRTAPKVMKTRKR